MNSKYLIRLFLVVTALASAQFLLLYPVGAACSSTAISAFSCIQGAGSIGGSNAASQSQAFGSNVASGHLIIVDIGWCNDSSCATNTSGTFTVTDTLTSTFHLSACATGVVVGSCEYFAFNSGSGADSVQCNKGSTVSFIVCNVEEWSGVATAANPLDQTGTGTNAASANPSATTSGNTTQANELIHSTAMVVSSGVGLTNGAGFTAIINVSNLNQTEAENGATTTTYTGLFSAGSTSWAAVVATYKPLASQSGTVLAGPAAMAGPAVRHL